MNEKMEMERTELLRQELEFNRRASEKNNQLLERLIAMEEKKMHK